MIEKNLLNPTLEPLWIFKVDHFGPLSLKWWWCVASNISQVLGFFSHTLTFFFLGGKRGNLQDQNGRNGGIVTKKSYYVSIQRHDTDHSFFGGPFWMTEFPANFGP